MKPKTNLAPRKPNFKYQLDSTLIESDHVPIFASWIDKKDSSHNNRKNIPYDFKLLYRSSQDGNDALSFHRNCDNKGATIWIAKIKNSTQLIDISTAKRSYVSTQNLAVFCGLRYGPTMEFYIVPNMKPKTNLAPRKPNFKYQLDSTLIESDYVPIFASWIDKKDSSHYNRKNIPYDFKLLHRSSQDGNNTLSFHRNCDNKGATIWIARIKNSTQLIGGYNPLN
ncbi:BTB/POZ protein [Rhizophagus irregularis DAOM 181602=DAOM 197198]|nr:BTB/POZ protein [Rhizophagus irregularis DAOM 181602=DAOM 197198]